jgi:L-asparagine transporter-like permease
VLAVSGTFQSLAAASAISRLVVYVATCASTLRLRSSRFDRVVRPPVFVVPFGPVIPVAAIVFALAILAGATPLQLAAGTGALSGGAVLYLIAVKGAAVDRSLVSRG